MYDGRSDEVPFSPNDTDVVLIVGNDETSKQEIGLPLYIRQTFSKKNNTTGSDSRSAIKAFGAATTNCSVYQTLAHSFRATETVHRAKTSLCTRISSREHHELVTNRAKAITPREVTPELMVPFHG